MRRVFKLKSGANKRRGKMFCLFCGDEMRIRYDGYTPYQECDCEDAVKDREIQEKILLLQNSRPRPKFEFKLAIFPIIKN
jgi:hypothetical protein